MKFKFTADCTLEAEDINEAMILIADQFIIFRDNVKYNAELTCHLEGHISVQPISENNGKV